MRKFVTALFGCCAPRRAGSTTSSLENDAPRDPRDIDEGSLVSSSGSFDELLYNGAMCPSRVESSVIANDVKIDNNVVTEHDGISDSGCINGTEKSYNSSLYEIDAQSDDQPELTAGGVMFDRSCTSLVFSVMSGVSDFEKTFSAADLRAKEYALPSKEKKLDKSNEGTQQQSDEENLGSTEIPLDEGVAKEVVTQDTEVPAIIVTSVDSSERNETSSVGSSYSETDFTDSEEVISFIIF